MSAFQVIDSADCPIDWRLLAPLVSQRLDAVAREPDALWDTDTSYFTHAWNKRIWAIDNGDDIDKGMMLEAVQSLRRAIPYESLWSYLNYFIRHSQLGTGVLIGTNHSHENWHLVASSSRGGTRPLPKLVQLHGNTFCAVRNVRIRVTGVDHLEWMPCTLMHLRRTESGDNVASRYAAMPVHRLASSPGPPATELVVGDDWALVAVRGPLLETRDERVQIELLPGGVALVRHMFLSAAMFALPKRGEGLVLQHAGAGERRIGGSRPGTTLTLDYYHDVGRYWAIRIVLKGMEPPDLAMSDHELDPRHGELRMFGMEQRARDEIASTLSPIVSTKAGFHPAVGVPLALFEFDGGQGGNQYFKFHYDGLRGMWSARFQAHLYNPRWRQLQTQFMPRDDGSYLMFSGVFHPRFILERYLPDSAPLVRTEGDPPRGWRVALLQYDAATETAIKALVGQALSNKAWWPSVFRAYSADVTRMQLELADQCFTAEDPMDMSD